MPKGAKFGGREAGVKNKDKQEVIDMAKKLGQTPVEYLLKVMNNEDNTTTVRIDAAKAVAPYVNRKMPQAIEADVQGTMEIVLFKNDELL